MFALSQDQKHKLLVVEAFRGSAKSTIFGLSLPIWSVIGIHEKKFVLIVCKTQQQARQTMKNIIDELTSNDFLKRELGPFDEPDDEWRQTSIVIPKYGARITAVSLDTSIRGIKHGAYRPDLMVFDDLEDLTSVKSKDNRDKLYTQLFGDIVPMGDIGTKVVVIGTRLHDDGLIVRLRRDIEADQLDGVFRSYPLLDDSGNILWPEKFPDVAAIEALRKTVPTIQAWSREYLLRIIDDEETVVRRDWIKRYTEMPSIEKDPDYIVTLTGVDLAITEDTKADCTSAVSMSLFRNREGDWKAYVHPFPLNEHLTFPDARKKLKMISLHLGGGHATPLYIESVQYQAAMPQDLRHDGFPAEEFKVRGQDKRQRLSLITHLIQEGIIVFPDRDCEDLIIQLVNFGAEKHDDLADAFAIAAHITMDKITMPGMVFPSQPGLAETADQEAVRKNDLWLADIKIAFEQGRVPPPQYFAACDQHLNRKREIQTAIYREQKRKEKEKNDQDWEQYEKGVYRQLMSRR